MPAIVMRPNCGMFSGTNMIFKKSFVNSIFYPLAALSGAFFITFASISYYVIDSGVKSSIESQLNATAEMFAGSIRKNIASGVESEVFRKCNSYAQNKDLKSVIVVSQDGRKICNIDKTEGNPIFQASRSIYFDEDKTQLAATITISFADTFRRSFLYKSIALLVLSCCLMMGIFFWIARFYVRKKIEPVTDLASTLSHGSLKELKEVSNNLDEKSVEEIRELYRGVEEQANKVELYQDEVVESAKWKTKSEFASIIAHDIKSPLSNIEMIIGDDDNDPIIREMLRKSVNRVYEMIGEVISNEQYGQEGQGVEAQIVPLDRLVEDQIAVTKYATESSSEIEIDFRVDKNKHLEVLLSPARFKRAVSNIIKNSREALINNRGKIEVSVFDTQSTVNVRIRDNGVGIEKEKIELLGTKGNTIGKKNGTGFGLYQVKEMVKASGGELLIESEKGRGMIISMIFPKYDALTRVSEIIVSDDQEIVILDDEEIIKNLWEQKFRKEGIKNLVHYFSNSQSFKKWYELRSSEENEKIIGLFDKDIKEKRTGLDLLTDLDMDQCYLVTGDYKNTDVIMSCRANSIGLIPKNEINDIILKKSASGEISPHI